MKKLIKAMSIRELSKIVMTIVFAANLSAQQNPSITIVNNTGYTVYYVYISPSDSDYWGQDRLDSDQIIRNGNSVTLRLPYPSSEVSRYDIRLTDSDGDTYTKMNVLLTANARIVFTFDDFDRSSAPAQSNPSITIVNNTGYTVYYVYISPTTHTSWGNDRLGSDQVLRNGNYVTLRLPYPLSEVSRYDIRLTDLDGDTYTRMNVLVTANARIVFTFDDID